MFGFRLYIAFLQLRRIQSQHQEELKRVTRDLEDESSNRSSMEKRLTDLRTEVKQTVTSHLSLCCVLHDSRETKFIDNVFLFALGT